MTHVCYLDLRLMITFVVVGVDRDNTPRGKRPEDRVVIEFHVCNCYETRKTRFFLHQSSWWVSQAHAASVTLATFYISDNQPCDHCLYHKADCTDYLLICSC